MANVQSHYKSNHWKILLNQSHLISLHPPHLHDSLVQGKHVELVLLVKDCTTIWPGIICQVKARRVGLGQEVSHVPKTRERFSEELEVVDFLETNDVRIVSDNLLQHPETTSPPVKSCLRTPDKLVVLGADRWWENNWFQKNFSHIDFYGIWSVTF